MGSLTGGFLNSVVVGMVESRGGGGVGIGLTLISYKVVFVKVAYVKFPGEVDTLTERPQEQYCDTGILSLTPESGVHLWTDS